MGYRSDSIAVSRDMGPLSPQGLYNRSNLRGVCVPCLKIGRNRPLVALFLSLSRRFRREKGLVFAVNGSSAPPPPPPIPRTHPWPFPPPPPLLKTPPPLGFSSKPPPPRKGGGGAGARGRGLGGGVPRPHLPRKRALFFGENAFFSPFSGGPSSTWELQKTEEKGLFRQIILRFA